MTEIDLKDKTSKELLIVALIKIETIQRDVEELKKNEARIRSLEIKVAELESLSKINGRTWGLIGSVVGSLFTAVVTYFITRK